MTNKSPSGAKKHCKSTEQEGYQTAKISFLLHYSFVNNSILAGSNAQLDNHNIISTQYYWIRKYTRWSCILLWM